ncbi:hypothetical protein ABIB15_001402 [Marisediminicola sp. UYEF4]
MGEGKPSRTERIPCRGIQFLVHRFAHCVPLPRGRLRDLGYSPVARNGWFAIRSSQSL